MALFDRSVRPSMASDSSRQSPTVTSRSVPPLTTKMVAARRKAAAFHGPSCRRGVTEGAEFSEAAGVSQLRHQWDQVLRRPRTEDPLQARADHIGTDQHERADPQVARQGHPAVGPLRACPRQHRLPPIRVSCSVCPAGLPPLLPGVTGLFGQPAQQPDHPQSTPLLRPGPRRYRTKRRSSRPRLTHSAVRSLASSFAGFRGGNRSQSWRMSGPIDGAPTLIPSRSSTTVTSSDHRTTRPSDSGR